MRQLKQIRHLNRIVAKRTSNCTFFPFAVQQAQAPTVHLNCYCRSFDADWGDSTWLDPTLEILAQTNLKIYCFLFLAQLMIYKIHFDDNISPSFSNKQWIVSHANHSVGWAAVQQCVACANQCSAFCWSPNCDTMISEHDTTQHKNNAKPVSQRAYWTSSLPQAR